MSKENVGKFYEALKSDKAMVEELQKLGNADGNKTPESSLAQVVKFAAAKGYVFTLEDLKAFEAESKELSEEDLSKVNAAAGVSGYLRGSLNRCVPPGSILKVIS